MAGLEHALLPGDRSTSVWQFRLVRSVFSAPTPAWVLLTAVIVLMAALFAVDLLLRPPVSVGALYCFAIYLSAAQCDRRRVMMTALAAGLLTLIGFVMNRETVPAGEGIFRCIFGIVIEIIIVLMVLRGMSVTQMLRDQAKLLDETHDSVVVRRLDATLLYWNLGAEKLFGWTFAEARKWSQTQLIGTGQTLPPMSIEEFIEHGPWHGEIVVFAKDRRRMVIDCRCSLLHDARGRPMAILTTGNDVTDREAATAAVGRSEARYRNIFQTTSIGIWECDFSAIARRLNVLVEEGLTDVRDYVATHPEFIREAIESTICVDVNEASVRMFAAGTRENMLGPVGWVWPKESEGVFAASVMAARAGKPSFESEVVLNTRDGRPLRFLLSSAFHSPGYKREPGSSDNTFVTVTDITARTGALAALQSAQADLAHATRLTSLGELAASIAHEVNQPLSSILASGQAGLRWLKREDPDLDAATASLDHLVAEAKRARDVVAGIRALARNELPQPTLLEIPDLIDETLRLLAYQLARSGVSVTTRFERAERPVLADRVQLQQVVINLLLNAVQAMAEIEDGRRQIMVAYSASDEEARVEIADTGAGVATGVRERLFTAFTSTRAEGMGLGLSVCASIISRHGGRIWLDDTAAAGACFIFSLPLAALVETEEAS